MDALVTLEPGTYVVAVSGGVDSMALLHVLAEQARQNDDLHLIVAHFDHGVRHDSSLDRQLVQEMSRRYGTQFVYDRAELGPHASEDQARRARYAFLRRVRQAANARAIITAHHQDDVLETAILNMLRGTAGRGLTSLRSHTSLKRPLLAVPKATIKQYARDQGLVWREDSTNTDMRYKRNHVRHHVMPRLAPEQRQELLEHIAALHVVHERLQDELTSHLHTHPALDTLSRYDFIMLPHAVAREVMAEWLRRHKIADLSAKMLERLVVAAKTYAPGQQADVDGTYIVAISKDALALKRRDR